MKKLLLFIAVLALCFSLAACGDTETPVDVDETNAIEETDGEQNPGGTEPAENTLPEGIDPKNFYKFVQFELPTDFRQAAVQGMRDQAAVEWYPEYTFTYGNKFDNWGYELTYKAGTKYTGLPYGALNSNMWEFAKYLEEHDGKYATTTDEGYFAVMGTQCNTAINLSLQKFMPTAAGISGAFMPSYPDQFIGIKVGDYDVKEGEQVSLNICTANGADKMYESYALADAGDVIMGKNDEKGVTHLRMVAAKAVVQRNNAGKINPHRSYLVCVEQTDTFDKQAKGKQTTWWLDHAYTFDTLYTSGWIAVSFDCYNTGKSVIPYIALDQEITPEILEKKTLTGTVTSDYPINSVYLSIYDKDNKLVSRQTQINDYDGKKVGLRKMSVNLFNDSLVAGEEYTFVCEAGIASGAAELARVKFTHKG